MRPYEPTTPRLGFGIAAGALTLLTFAVFVAVPANRDSTADPRSVLAAPKPDAAAPVEVTIIPSRIDVIGVRPRTVAVVEPDAAPRKANEGS